MRRRPGLWLTLGALAAGVVLLIAAGCGGNNNGGAASGGNTNAIPPHQNGGVIKTAEAGNIDYLDPALAYYQTTWQIEYSTCVKLTNYPDLPGDAGRQIVPEAASAENPLDEAGKAALKDLLMQYLYEAFYKDAASQYYDLGIPPELEGELKGAEKDLIVVLLDSWGKHSRVGDANRIRKWLESASPDRSS